MYATDIAAVAQRQFHSSHCFPQDCLTCPPSKNKASLTPWTRAPSLWDTQRDSARFHPKKLCCTKSACFCVSCIDAVLKADPRTKAKPSDFPLVSLGFTGNAAFHCVCHARRERRLAFLPVTMCVPRLLRAVSYLPGYEMKWKKRSHVGPAPGIRPVQFSKQVQQVR